MSKRRQLLDRLSSLEDLRDVFAAMRNLAMAEIAKLSSGQAVRQHLREELTTIAGATAPLFRQAFVEPHGGHTLYAILGSERSFCGDFNERVAARWTRAAQEDTGANGLLIGSALAEKIDDGTRIVASVAGATIAEDIDDVLAASLREISLAQANQAEPLHLVVIGMSADGVSSRTILPFQAPGSALERSVPELYLSVDRFARRFVESYLDAELHTALSDSLLAENRARLTHMTSALNRADDRAAELKRQVNHLRQEEITESIEGILLSTTP